MMRSMFSGVAGLKTHQTKMDVIGNNIANVNTTSYKSSSINFSELLYQTTSRASGPNATTGRAGINPKQIGLGVQSAAINTNITSPGAAQSTGNPFDVRIKGDAFFVVSDGSTNYFTRDGSFYVDAAGNLAMTSNGFNVMGWGVDEATQTIHKDKVQALQIMNAANMTYPPAATTEAYVDGILDRNEPDASTSAGKTLVTNFYDSLGYSYTAKFAIRATDTKGEYTVELTDIIDSEGNSLIDLYNVNNIEDIATFGSSGVLTSTELRQLATGVKYTPPAAGATEGTYSKELLNEELFADYTANTLTGLVYKPTNNPTNGTQFTEGTSIPVSATGTVSRKDLESVYGLIYVTKDADGKALTDPYYHYKKEDGTTVQLTAASPAADWEEALKKTGLSGATIDADGNVSFTHATTLTFARDGVIGVSGTAPNETYVYTATITQDEAYDMDTSNQNVEYVYNVAEDGQAQVTKRTSYKGNILKFNVDTGYFESIAGQDSVTLDFNTSAQTKTGAIVSLQSFSDINMDWSNTTWFNNGGASTISTIPGTSGLDGRTKGLGAGRPVGAMDGISIQENGEIYASYDNGMTRLLGQIAVAKFANPAGLEKSGENLYSATLNSGEFDGVGQDITEDGSGGMVTGSLEMSNVDLSQEFTEMITTQRGFQANSRIITVSDTLLEELVNLKR